MAGGHRAPAGRQAGLGCLGALGGAAAAAPGRRGPGPRGNPGAAAPFAQAPREREARQDPGASPRGARGTRSAAPDCVKGTELLTAAPPPRPTGPQSPPTHGSSHRPRASARWCPTFPGPCSPDTTVSPLPEPGALPADLRKQCAAVSTHWGAMSEPPHTCAPRCWMLACQGHSPAPASWPPTIRLDTRGCPQAARRHGEMPGWAEERELGRQVGAERRRAKVREGLAPGWGGWGP